jgi:thioredoxin reductase (NADPH)
MNKTSLEFVWDYNENFKGLKIKDNDTQEESVLEADGAFIFIGLITNTQSFKDVVALDKAGFIQTTALAETSVSGIFAAGDCREGAIAQIVAATGEGVLASYGIRS